jgi:tetratricopeptide (TPR) repeat protein
MHRPMAAGAACTAFLCAATFALAVPDSGAAFSHLSVGDRAPRVELAALAGGRAPLFKDSARTNVFVFLEPDQESTDPVLTTLAKLEERFAKSPVYFSLVVSDTTELAAFRSLLQKHSIHMPVLLDAGDELQGRLGVLVFPSVGILNNKGELLRYQFFLKVNFFNVLEGEIRHALGEIDDAQLEAVLNPSRPQWGGDAAAAARYIKLAEIQLKASQYDKAMQSAKSAAEKDPKSAAAHGLAASIWAAQGRCAEAQAEVRLAVALDPDEPHASAARDTCGGK